MGKFPIFFLLLGIAALAAALFGALHNQLSYTMGPTYFTAFKFDQFQIADGTPPRLGAAYVGVMASWWMGPIIGLPAFLYGLFAVPSARTYFAAGCGAVFTVIFLATFGALAGLIGGLVADTTGLLDPYLNFRDGPTRSDFLRAGFMHDASYLAGALGLIAAVFPIRRGRKIDLHRAEVRTEGGVSP
ncbi:hypothetical protein [Hasllibacter sp. MH4015]|uniref:hypothetical protein n=1 Tax=Hasllibacter sp. MH4015 TaxID=2854029 RepID=UPI001CD55A3F|nr:hypothetical protein [Hasllibacter sp. MH4015]